MTKLDVKGLYKLKVGQVIHHEPTGTKFVLVAWDGLSPLFVEITWEIEFKPLEEFTYDPYW